MRIPPLFRNTEALSKTVYLLGGLSPFVNAVMDPLTLNHEYKRNRLPDKERWLLLTQEIANKSIELAIHCFMFFVLPLMVMPFLKRFVHGAEPQKHMYRLVSAVFGHTGGSLIRPWLAPMLFMHVLGKQQQAHQSHIKPFDLLG